MLVCNLKRLEDIDKVKDLVDGIEFRKKLFILNPHKRLGKKVIRSYHNFHSNEAREGVDKLAVMAESTLDALRMLKTRKAPIQVCMGEKGQLTRILGPVFGNLIDYTYLDEPSAPGQLSLHELLYDYNYRQLNPETEIYGLIGGDVSKSFSPRVHNGVMRALGINAVYVKMSIEPKELEEFFSLAKDLNFRGLSVTMPLKEKVIPYLDELDPLAAEISAVNTISFKNNKLIGYNTDGIGAIEALGCVKNKRIILLGKGGAAKAIAYVATLHGAQTQMLGRGELPTHPYDLLINCTPADLPAPLNIHSTSPFGREMFINQAVHQYRIWFKE